MTSGTETPAADRDLRTRIVAEAATLFESVGYHQTSMAAISAAVGLSKPTVYHYFPSKAAILYEIHDQYLDDVIQRHIERRSKISDASTLIRGFVYDVFQLTAAGSGRVRVFFEYSHELSPELALQLRAKRAQYLDVVRMMIYQGVESRQFETDDVALDAYALFGMCNWAYRWLNPAGRRTIDEVAEHFANLFLRGLAVDASSKLNASGEVTNAGRATRNKR